MGLTDKFKDLTEMARDAAVEHKDQVNQAVQKAGELADERTGRRYHDQLAKAGAKAEAFLEDLQPTKIDEPVPPGDS